MPPASNEATSFTGTLEIARRDLLDLGLRNTLLNYRPLRSKGIEVIDEKPIEVFQLLVKEEKSLTFLSGDAVGPHSNGTTTDVQLVQPEDEGRSVITSMIPSSESCRCRSPSRPRALPPTTRSTSSSASPGQIASGGPWQTTRPRNCRRTCTTRL